MFVLPPPDNVTNAQLTAALAAYSLVRSIQPVVVTIAGAAASGSTAITAVVLAKSFIIPAGSFSNSGVATILDTEGAWSFSSTTLVQVARSTAALATAGFAAFVVELK